MKQCPECRRVYADETLNFCLEDGAVLIYGRGGAIDDRDDAAATAILTGGEPPAPRSAAEDWTRLVSSTSPPGRDVNTGLGSRPGEGRETPSPRNNSIAVLPFVNMSADPENEYFCDGLAEDLLNALAKIEDLRVAARTSAFSFKGKNEPIGGIARALNVDTVLEGSVRKSGSRLRITAQLINAADGYHLWSEKYDRELKDIFDIQDEITLAIVDALKVRLMGPEKAGVLQRATESAEAYQLYLKGRYHANKYVADGVQKGIEYYRQAIDIDPTYALAYAGLADAYVLLIQHAAAPKTETTAKARAAALRAIELDDRLAEAHSALGLIKTFYEWDWAGAERELQRAVELNPNSAHSFHLYGIYLCIAARFDESLAAYTRAHELDPLSPGISEHLGWPHYYSRRYELAEAQFRKTLEMEPDFKNTLFRLGLALTQMGRYDEAEASFKRSFEVGDDRDTLAWLGYVYAITGRRRETSELLAQLEERSRREYVPAYAFAIIHLGLGEKDKALDWLETAARQHDYWLIFSKVDPFLDPLRGEDRFEQIERAVALP